MRRALVLGAGFWLLIDLLRVWAPSLITIFGQAASTPAELMGGFALACVLAGVLPVAGVQVTGLSGIATCRVCLVGMLGCRVVLQVVGGGQVQLWVASVGVALSVAWFALATRWFGRDLLPGFAVGTALAVTGHAFLGTWAAVWRDDLWAWSLVAVQVVLVGSCLSARGSAAASRALALALLPGLLVAGIWAANPARASTSEQTWGPALAVAGAVAAVGFARSAFGRLTVAVAGLVLCAATALVLLPDQSTPFTLLAYCFGAPALVIVLGGCAGPAPHPLPEKSQRPAYVAIGGAALWVVLFFAYYAGYDLGYRADLLVVAVAVVLSAAAVWRTPPAAPLVQPDLMVATVLVVPVALATVVGPFATISTVEPPRAEHEGLTVMAWNLRMGYGIDGSFAIDEVAELIRDQDPDVVLLSEVDRAWLLNGGQDQLVLLSRLLGMDAYFGPAADPVWGDAVLTSLPVSDVDAHPLPSHDAVTGAQALALTVAKDGQKYDVISTHVQPHQGAGDGSLAQAREIADFAADRVSDRRPVVIGGDFNLEPGDDAWQALRRAGFNDALAKARPLPTSPADDPQDQIDHVFVTPGVRAVRPAAVDSELSDHLPVVVTLRVRR